MKSEDEVKAGSRPPAAVSPRGDVGASPVVPTTAPGTKPPYTLGAAEVVADLGSNETTGLTAADASARLARYGENKITSEKPPSVWEVALGQLRDPMNIMLVAVTVVSLVIGQVPTAIVVALLVLLNVVLGTRQELQARASVDALSKMQVPQAKVVRAGQLVQVPAFDVVPGDIVQVEAGDIVPADGRIIRSATLELKKRRSPARARPSPKTEQCWRQAMSGSATARTCCSRTPR